MREDRQRIHRHEGQRPHRFRYNRHPLQGVDGRSEDRSEHQGPLLPSSGHSRDLREHPRHKHRRPLPGAFQDILFRERRRARDVHGLVRHDAPQPPGQGGDSVPGAGQEDARADQGRHPPYQPIGQCEGQGAPARRNLRVRPEGGRREEDQISEVVHRPQGMLAWIPRAIARP